ncbi:MAG TPA: bacillithiol biosynthesis deacetylase BshB1 [Bacteroidia bacterium]|nr:bacillithiol biosynthesis deacetylase BshB1 [Bacteroidia bacterium]
MKLDILTIAAHPDDVELSCVGTIIKAIKAGKKVGMIDLTEGQLGTRGTNELRLKEAAAAAKIIGATVRENLGLMDGYFEHNHENRLKLIQKIRQYQPDIIITNPPLDRHPDHGRCSAMVTEAWFYSGLRKIETELDGVKQEPFRPSRLFYFMQHYNYEPSFVVDISDEMEQKLAAIKAFASQFHSEDSTEPETLLSQPHFLDSIVERCGTWGHAIGTRYAEGFITPRKIFGVNNIFEIK